MLCNHGVVCTGGFQEISLYNELTIEELLLYYGRVHGMTKEDITSRCNFLLDFLKLPARSANIGVLRCVYPPSSN